MTVSTEDTVAGFKDHIFDKAKEECFSMAGIDQQKMIIFFRSDGDGTLRYYLDDTKFEGITCPKFAFLPGFL